MKPAFSSLNYSGNYSLKCWPSLKSDLMCVICVGEASLQGKIVIYQDITTETCKKHPKNILWRVNVSEELEDLLKHLTLLDA